MSVRFEYVKTDLEIGKGSSAKWEAQPSGKLAGVFAICIVFWSASLPTPGGGGVERIEISPLN